MFSVIDALNFAINQVRIGVSTQSFTGAKVALFTDFDDFTQTDLNRFRSEVIPKLIKLSIQLIIMWILVHFLKTCFWNPFPRTPQKYIWIKYWNIFENSSDLVPNSRKCRQLSESQKLAVELMEVTEQSSLGFCYDLKSALKAFNEFEVKSVSYLMFK